jgi:hypothetical protein
MTGADRIRWSTAGAVFGVAVAAVTSYEHAYERCGVAAFEVFRSRRDVLRAAFLCPYLWLLGPQEKWGGGASRDDSGEYGCEVGEQDRAKRDRSDV